MNIYSTIYLILLLLTLLAFIGNPIKQKAQGRFLVYYLLLLLVGFAGSVFITNFLGLKNNLFIFHISCPIEYTLIALLYRSLFAGRPVKKFIGWSVVLFWLACILLSAFIQHPHENNSYEVVIQSILIMVLCLLYLKELLMVTSLMPLEQQPLFWITVGILFYFTGNLVIMGMLNYAVSHDMMLARRIFRVGHIFEYLLFLLFITGTLAGSMGKSKTGFDDI